MNSFQERIMTTITLSHVSKRFEQQAGDATRTVSAVDDLSLKIMDGEVVAILGPSGCGKSTLLRLIAGLIEPDAGEIYYDHDRLNDVPLQNRGIGMVFQDGALMPHWVSEQTVGFFMWLRKREQEVPARVARISEITGIGLEKLMDRKPSQLSGGEKQRVAIARALTRDPRVFLFDEPFSSLDAKLRTNARIELKKLLREFPVTSVYVTHDQNEAVSLAHRIAVMRAGKIEQIGDYQTLYENPRNLFVATFVGVPTINLFDGRVENSQWTGKHFGPYPVRHDLPDGARVIAGVRAEGMKLAENGVLATVTEAIEHYPERHQVVEVEADGERWSMTLPMQPMYRPGDTIRSLPDEAALLYFDAKTGQRIG
jgi:multiple sugar transport system ATP-binding protein